MPRTVSEPQISRSGSQDFSARKCEEGLDGEDSCPVQDRKKFPAINEVQTRATKKDTGKFTSKVVSLPKLNLENISELRIDAGEPYGSNYSISSAEIGTFRQACDNLKQFLKLGASSSEELDRALLLSEYQTHSDRSSVRSKIFENFEREENEVIEESHALKRWEYWLEDKKKVQNSLSKRLGRPVDDLLMQDSDKFREVMEKKMMRWYSRIPEPDKWRGSPIRWEPQMRIRNKKAQAQYCLIKSKMEKEEEPEMEFIGIPNPIKKEKGLLSDDEFQNSKRKAKPDTERRVHCKEESNCDSHKIEMEELAVVGMKIVDSTMNSHNLFKPKDVPIINVEKLEDEEQLSKCLDRTSVFSLVIGDEEIKYEMGSESRLDPDRVFVWNVDFGVNMIGSTSEEVLRVENRGTIAVRYDWLASKFEKKSSFGCLQPRHFEPWFFFNKNSGYFLPGQIYDMKFYFQGRISGIRKETWYLRTSPPLSEKAQLATVVLSGVATEECSTEIKTLDFYLENRVVESYIYAIIEEMIYKALDPSNGLHDIEYRCFFTEKQLFECQNSKHFYHSSVVKELKKIFEEIPDKNQKEWDMSLTSLWHLIKIYKTGKEKSASLREVAELSKILYRPNYLPVRSDAGYKMSYSILCKMINFIENDYNHIRNLVSEKIEEPARWRDWGEARESTVSTETAPEEMGEADSKTILQIRPINFMFFRTLVHLKTYRRICEATEQIAGIFETRKKFKSWKTLSYKPQLRVAKRPSRRVNSNDFWPEQLNKPQVNILTLK